MIKPSSTFLFRSGCRLQVVSSTGDRVYYAIDGVRSMLPLWMPVEQFIRMMQDGMGEQPIPQGAPPP